MISRVNDEKSLNYVLIKTLDSSIGIIPGLFFPLFNRLACHTAGN